MNVWFVNQYAIPPDRAGGTWHYTIAQELTKRGHSVTVIAGSVDHGSGDQYATAPRKAWKRERVNNVDFLWLRVPEYHGNSLARIRSICTFAVRVWLGTGMLRKKKPNIVVGTVPTPFAALSAQRLAKRLAARFFLDIRDLWPGQIADVGRQSRRIIERLVVSPPILKPLELLERHLYRKAESVLTVIPRAEEHIVRRGVPPEKIVWLPQVVDFSLVPVPSPPKRNDNFTIIYAGTFGSFNDLDTVLTTASILQKKQTATQVRFRLIGNGPEKKRLRQRVIEEQLNIVSIEAAVSKSAIYQVLQEADAFLASGLASSMLRYGISFQKVFDYMASARPTIIVTTEERNPITEAEAGIRVNPGDPEALASGILQLVAMPLAERLSMGARGRAVVERMHNAMEVADRLEKLFAAKDCTTARPEIYP